MENCSFECIARIHTVAAKKYFIAKRLFVMVSDFLFALNYFLVLISICEKFGNDCKISFFSIYIYIYIFGRMILYCKCTPKYIRNIYYDSSTYLIHCFCMVEPY